MGKEAHKQTKYAVIIKRLKSTLEKEELHTEAQNIDDQTNLQNKT